ncbi:fatty acid desaturase-domain-containing protein [Aspergillus novoparasiticus]|uniref:Delta 8-(E)-sphingolipid desaturase n=1 Tax=Aspergillus novoparasiticus TaxID=986946 RepID=A0A5N6EI16_9EURO|nr:fatty acid desaturase-domain-containing protein [Aspergillus novoparasiticus]
MQRSTKDATLSRRQIEALIAQGQSIIIVNQKVLRVDAWIPYHPGGQKVIQHVVGKDATDEFTVFHCEETRQMSERYQIGRIEGRWTNFVPPIQGGVFRSEEEEEDDESTILVKEELDTPSTGLEAASIDADIHKRHSQAESTEDIATQDEMTFLDTETKEEIKLTLSKYPPLDDATQDEIIAKYRLLHKQIHAEGLYKCNYTAYAWEFARCSLLFSIMLFFLHIGWYNTSALFLAWFWSQMVFAAHDAGHIGITQNFTIDSLIGMTIAAPIGGLSLGWWKRSHNVHHIVTNAPEHDPDNQHLPFLAVNHRFLGNIFSTYHERLLAYDKFAKALVPYQAYLYYIILLFGRFNLYVQSWLFLAKAQGPRKGPAKWHRWYEICGNVIFWLWFGYGILYKSIPTPLSRISFVLISHMATMPLHVQFTVSHFAMSTTDLGPNESFAQKMLRTTMDVDCPPWLDWVHGGLQFQAIHHLYPRVPRHNLRRAQALVMEFCRDVGIPYALYGFVGGNRKVLGGLAEVARQAAILEKCRRTVVERGEFVWGL